MRLHHVTVGATASVVGCYELLDRRGATRDPQGNLVEVLESRGPFA